MTSTLLLPDFPVWHTEVSDATFNTAARAGEAEVFDVLEETDVAVVGQILTGGVYTVHELFMAFDISALAGHQIESVEFTVDTFNDITTSQTWTGNLRAISWTGDQPVESTHVGSGGFADHPLLASFTMANANDVPLLADVWTNTSFMTYLQSLVDAESTHLKCYIHSARHGAEAAPVDSERWGIIAANIKLTILHHAPVEATIEIPAPTIAVTEVPQVAATMSVPGPSADIPERGWGGDSANGVDSNRYWLSDASVTSLDDAARTTIKLIACLAPDDWSPAADKIIGGWVGALSFYLTTGGRLAVQVREAGGDFISRDASAAHSLEDGRARWIGFQVNVAAATVDFYTAGVPPETDPGDDFTVSPWALSGTAGRTLVGYDSTFWAQTLASVGTSGLANAFVGRIHTMRGIVDGTLDWDLDFIEHEHLDTVVTDDTGTVWTGQGAGTQVIIGREYTGPVVATIEIPAPAMTITTTRRYHNDELYGIVSDDGRRYGRVV